MMHAATASQVARVESQIRSHADRHNVVHLDGYSADDPFFKTVFTQRMLADVPGPQPSPPRVVSPLGRRGSPGVRRTPRRAPMLVAESISHGAVATGKPTACLDCGRHTELAVRGAYCPDTAPDAGGPTKKPRSDSGTAWLRLAGVNGGDRPLMSSGLVVYLYLYTAPGLNDRRFGRRTIIVTHVDIGRQDNSDSSWRSAGGGTSQKGSLFGTNPDCMLTCPGVAFLSTRFLCRTCVGVSLRRILATSVSYGSRCDRR